MRTNEFSMERTDPLSEMGLGCWQLGGSDWGSLDDATALDILRTAADAGDDVFRHRRRIRRRT